MKNYDKNPNLKKDSVSGTNSPLILKVLHTTEGQSSTDRGDHQDQEEVEEEEHYGARGY